MANKSHMASEFYIDLSNAIFVLEQEEVSLTLKEDLGRLGGWWIKAGSSEEFQPQGCGSTEMVEESRREKES